MSDPLAQRLYCRTLDPCSDEGDHVVAGVSEQKEGAEEIKIPCGNKDF
jgi:hypothetical protein